MSKETQTKDDVIADLRKRLSKYEGQTGVGVSKSSLEQTDKKGAFKRKNAVFRDVISKEGKFKPESGRYVLYVSYACPWASRCLALLFMKKLDKHIDLCTVHPTWQRTRPNDASDTHAGWIFMDPDSKLVFPNIAGHGKFGAIKNLTLDTANGFKTVRDIYESQEKVTHTFSVPILYDKKTKLIVCNESSMIIEMFNKEFNDLSGVEKKMDLSPPELQKKVDEINEWVYSGINNGVYKCGFAKSQEAYEDAFANLFGSLDKVEEILSKNRYLTGSKLTMADIRLFVTIIRFDEVYHTYFKCNGKHIIEYPNLLGWTRELYQMPGVKESVDMRHIKQHYYTSHPTLNLYGVVPLGRSAIPSKKGENIMDFWLQPHGREKL